jgi:ribosomal protein L6P/L9E
MKHLKFINFSHSYDYDNLINSTRLPLKIKDIKNGISFRFNLWSNKIGATNINRFVSYDEDSSKALNSQLRGLKEGFESGYFVELILKGIGFKVFQFENTLFLQLGFSHFYIYKNVHKNVVLKAKRDRILIFGSNKQLVGNVAYEIGSLRTPDSYKAKGIQFKDKTYILKEGKKK